MSGLSAMKSNLSTEKTPFPAISWYIEGGLLKNKKKIRTSYDPLDDFRNFFMILFLIIQG